MGNINRESRIYIAGHQGLVESAIINNLKDKGYSNIICRTHNQLNLIDLNAVSQFFKEEKPEFVILAAAKVGGIVANNVYRADFINENLMIQTNVIYQAFLHRIKKLLFLGSTCINPNKIPQPIKEEYLLTNTLEFTKEPYEMSEIAGIKMGENYNQKYSTSFISVRPTNLYGPRDNFNLENSHLLPSLIRKIHLGKALEEKDWETIADDFNRRPIEGIDGSQGKNKMLGILSKYGIKAESINNEEDFQKVSVKIWASSKEIREFIWREDMAEACIFLLEKIDFLDLIQKEPEKDEVRNNQINIGTGRDISIAHLAEIVKIIIKFRGELFFNSDKPEGMARKLTDISRVKAMGWKHEVELDEGIFRLYNWYKSSVYNKYV